MQYGCSVTIAIKWCKITILFCSQFCESGLSEKSRLGRSCLRGAGGAVVRGGLSCGSIQIVGRLRSESLARLAVHDAHSKVNTLGNWCWRVASWVLWHHVVVDLPVGASGENQGNCKASLTWPWKLQCSFWFCRLQVGSGSRGGVTNSNFKWSVK